MLLSWENALYTLVYYQSTAAFTLKLTLLFMPESPIYLIPSLHAIGRGGGEKRSKFKQCTHGGNMQKKKKNTSQANANQRLQWDNVYKHIYKQQQVHYSNQTFYGWCTCTWFSIFINQYFLCCETKKTINYFFHRYKHIVFDAFVVGRMAATIVVPKLYFYYNVNVLCITLIKAI